MDSVLPHAVIFAGPNGSGKSTLIAALRASATYNIPSRYINADDIARELTGGSQEDRERAAFRQARQLRQDYRLAGLSFAFETVFSHPSTLVDLLKLRAAGYETIFLFVATKNVETNIRRVKQRFVSGGHDVPVEKIRSRYERAFAFLPLAAEIADQTFVWDNTLELRRVCEVKEGKARKTADCTPFYETRFLNPFNARRQERIEWLGRFPEMQAPEIESGIYSGQIVETRAHFCLQNASNSAVLHDRTLLTDEPLVKQSVQIVYRDGYGTIQSTGDTDAQS